MRQDAKAQDEKLLALGADLRSVLDFMVRVNIDSRGGPSRRLAAELAPELRQLGLTEVGKAQLAELLKKYEVYLERYSQDSTPGLLESAVQASAPAAALSAAQMQRRPPPPLPNHETRSASFSQERQLLRSRLVEEMHKVAAVLANDATMPRGEAQACQHEEMLRAAAWGELRTLQDQGPTWDQANTERNGALLGLLTDCNEKEEIKKAFDLIQEIREVRASCEWDLWWQGRGREPKRLSRLCHWQSLRPGGSVHKAFVWVVSQSGHRKFGEEVDAALLEDETSGLAFSAKGVVVLDGEEVFVEKVEVQKMEAWRKDRMLEGGDARLLGDHRDASGRRRLDLATAVELMKSEPDDEFPISGVRAAKELHDAICSGPGNLVSYHSEWLRLSGVSRKSSAAHIHSSLCECLRLLHSYDQIDASSTAVGEHLSRWMVQTELAVERNPMAPDYAGLDIVAGTAVQADGRASTGRFNEWVSSRLRERAQIWKQERLYAQERRGLRGKKGGGKGDESDSESEPGKNKQKKKKKGGKPGDGGGKGSRGAIVLADAEDIARRVESYGGRPDNLDEEAALRDMRDKANLYGQEDKNVVPMCLDRIKILQRSLDPIPAMELASPEAGAFLRGFATMIERPAEELEALRSSGGLVEPYWDAGLRKDRGRRVQLYQMLWKSGLLDFRRRRKARVGLFTVRKKQNWQRLIVDARQANFLQQAPPTARLATAAGLAAVDLSAHSLGIDVEAEGYEGPAGETGDVGDCFYNFKVDSLTSWFGTDDIFTPLELRTFGIVDIVCHQSLLALGLSSDSLIRDRCPAPQVKPESPAVGIYVDNVHVFAAAVQEARDAMDKIQNHFSELGIPFETDHVAGKPSMDTLGLTFEFGKEVRVRTSYCRLFGADYREGNGLYGSR
ncbi:unnamed protein product [Effrenium voratum]|nr:unnamed protein product [Effrenium voratum]